MVQAGAVEFIAGMLKSKIGRTGLFQVVYFLGPTLCVSAVFISCSLNQWELVPPDLSFSSVWIILSSAFFSFASPAAFIWMPGSHHRWPSNHPRMAMSLQWEGTSELPLCVLCIFANVLSRLQIRFRFPAPTDHVLLKICPLGGSVFCSSCLDGWTGWRHPEVPGVVHVCMHERVACACPRIAGVLEQCGVGDGDAPSAAVQGLRCWFSCLPRSAERTEGRGNAWKLRRLPRVSGFVVVVWPGPAGLA